MRRGAHHTTRRSVSPGCVAASSSTSSSSSSGRVRVLSMLGTDCPASWQSVAACISSDLCPWEPMPCCQYVLDPIQDQPQFTAEKLAVLKVIHCVAAPSSGSKGPSRQPACQTTHATCHPAFGVRDSYGQVAGPASPASPGLGRRVCTCFGSSRSAVVRCTKSALGSSVQSMLGRQVR